MLATVDRTGCESGHGPAKIPSMSEQRHANPRGIARLLRLSSRHKQAQAELLLPPPSTSGVYVDIENLKGAEHARTVMEKVVQDWPESLPPLRRLYLYAPADMVGLWHTWAAGRFSEHHVLVRGIQRFTRASKNSADMAIVADVIADFTARVVHHIAVVSNDSDFGALFVKLQELASESSEASAPPFLWINLAGGSGLSGEIIDFVPERLRWVITLPSDKPPEKTSKGAKLDADGLPSIPTVVQWLLEEVPPGRFRAGDVRKIIKRRCPQHPAAETNGSCGIFLSQQLMPLLGKKGVTVVRQQPRTYERAG